jgi:hypothetical protein
MHFLAKFFGESHPAPHSIMTTTMFNPKFAFLALGLAVSTASFADDKTLLPSGTISVDAAKIINTRELVPAVDTTVRMMPRRPENELIFKIKPGDPNNRTKPGGMLSVPRVSGAESRFPSIEATGWTPPDPDMGIGPEYVVCVVNSSIGFFRKKDGQRTFQRTFGDFFAGLGAGSFLFDPKATYDPISKRFFVFCPEQDGATKTSKMLIAVSDDSDPNGNWFRYRVDSKFTDSSNNEYWLDYPGIGVSRNLVGFCGNMFGFTDGWAGNIYWVLPKDKLLTGAAATATLIPDSGNASVKLAAVTDTPNLYSLSVESGTSLRVQSITTSGVTETSVSVPPLAGPAQNAQGPNGHNLSALDGRLFNTLYRSGNLVASHCISPVGESALVSRWYDVALNGWPTSGKRPATAQSGQVRGPAGQAYHMPAVAKNRRGDMGMVFTRTSSSIQADLMVTGRKVTDLPGTMGVPTVMVQTKKNYGGSGTNRWGDYFGMGVDPVDDLTFWAYGMTGRDDGAWITQVVSFKISSYTDSARLALVNSAAPLPDQGTIGAGLVANLNAADSKSLDVSSQTVKSTGDVASLRTDYNTGILATTFGYLKLDVKLAAVSDATAFVYLWNTRLGKYDVVTTAPATGGVISVERTEAQAADYVTATGSVAALVRIVRPVRGSAAQKFTAKFDQMSLRVSEKL